MRKCFLFYSRLLGVLANKVGACNCQCLGALPVESSKQFLAAEIKSFSLTGNNKEGGEQVDALHGSVEGTPSALCKHFQDSLHADIDATQELLKSINLQSVSTFVDLIDNCAGNVLTSAIGRTLITVEWIYLFLL